MRAEQGDLSLIASPNIIRGEVASSYQKGRKEGRKEGQGAMVRGARRSLARHRLPGSTLPALPLPRGTRLESCGCAALGVRGGGVLPLYYLLRPLPPLFPTAAKHH